MKLLEQINNLEAKAKWIWINAKSRRKITLQVSKTNQLGFFKEKSQEIIPINSCLIATQNISNFIPALQSVLNKFPQSLIRQISITQFDNCLSLIFYLKKDLEFSQNQKLTHFAKEQHCNISTQLNDQTSPLIKLQNNEINIANKTLNLDPNIFIQATKKGTEEIISIIKNEVKKDQNIVDIYSGFGLYSFAISNMTKSVSSFEGNSEMIKLAKENIKNNQTRNIVATQRDIFQNPLSARELNIFDLAIINPPRNGATPQIKEITKSDLQNLIYVSCNPRTFFYDAKFLLDSNFKIKNLFALDQFYLTKHLELIGVFTK
ncbi:MAG: methyltransferase [Rickettsiales bacterium]|nr:methyltransferase [Rickettsiales bacterium]